LIGVGSLTFRKQEEKNKNVWVLADKGDWVGFWFLV